MKLGSLAGSDFELTAAESSVLVKSLTADSRQVEEGSVFFALPGVIADGADFIPQALDKGAVAIVARYDVEISGVSVPISVPVLKADDPRKSLAKMAAGFFPNQPETMVAVTGTAGKTSVAAFVRQIWALAGFQAASIGTTGVVAPDVESYGNLTTPDPVSLHKLLDELAGSGVTHGAMEASSHGLDQHRLDGVRLSAVAFTNLGRDHMDYHPTIDDYFDAKMRLFRDLVPAGTPAVIYADDEFSQRSIKIAKEAGLNVMSVGRNGDFLTLKRIEHERFRQNVEIHHGSSIYRIEFPLAGDFQIANGLVAAGLAIATGVDAGKALSALETLEGAPGRLELIGRLENSAPLYVDYAHKPDSLEKVLTSLRPFTSGKLVLVYGCGGDRDKGKRPIMGEIAERLADISIVTDDNPRSEKGSVVRSEILATNPSAKEIADRGDAIRYGVSVLSDGDCLVVAGKGHEEGQIVGSQTLPFSDKKLLQEILVQGNRRGSAK
ncbi:MAG: UDP-N-acetylmuramoyl-L-alanyl-D-glutamate--2,6-diaminopimelate ligase [Rhizobiaceae bacterium]